MCPIPSTVYLQEFNKKYTIMCIFKIKCKGTDDTISQLPSKSGVCVW